MIKILHTDAKMGALKLILLSFCFVVIAECSPLIRTSDTGDVLSYANFGMSLAVCYEGAVVKTTHAADHQECLLLCIQTASCAAVATRSVRDQTTEHILCEIVSRQEDCVFTINKFGLDHVNNSVAGGNCDDVVKIHNAANGNGDGDGDGNGGGGGNGVGNGGGNGVVGSNGFGAGFGAVGGSVSGGTGGSSSVVGGGSDGCHYYRSLVYE